MPNNPNQDAKSISDLLKESQRIQKAAAHFRDRMMSAAGISSSESGDDDSSKRCYVD